MDMERRNKIKSQGLFVATRSFEHISAFLVVFDLFGAFEAIGNKITKIKSRYLYGIEYD